jgi:hypothetical protein
LRRIHRWIKANTRKHTGSKARVLVRRTASELLKARTLSGCNDWGILFTTLARACGLPAIYVKAIKKSWARRWMEGDESGKHLGHVFIEVYVNKKWILVDSTTGFYYTKYKPSEPNLPRGHYAYSKSKDPWDIGAKSMYIVNKTLENIAEYLDGRKLVEPRYPRGFLIPTVAVVASRPVVRHLSRGFKQIRFQRRTIRSLRRNPAKTEGMDVLILVRKNKLNHTLKLVADPLGMDGRQLNDLITNRRFPQLLRLNKRPVCVAPAETPDALMALGKRLLGVSDARESAIRADRCRPGPPLSRKRPMAGKPLSERLRRAAPSRFRSQKASP